MANINLLPWREALKRRKDKNLLIMSIIYWGLCLGLGIFLVGNVNAKLAIQNDRNQFLNTKLAELKREVKNIETLQVEKQALLERIEIIQNLQQDRVQIVHVFDDIVRKLPAGVTLDQIAKKQNEIHLQGRAQSNTRVSELMNKVDTSKWFGQADLTLVDVNASDDNQLSTFTVVLTEKIQNNNNDAEEAKQ